jgi:mannosyltransferase
MLRGLRIGFGAVGVLAACGLAAIGALSYLKRTATVAWLFMLPGIVTAAGMLAMRAPIRPRFFIFLLGFALLMLVRGAMEAARFVSRWKPLASYRPETVATAAVSIVAIVSAYSLRYNYRYPKQDFDGALHFIESHRAIQEPIATAGLATYPYAHYYGRQWTALDRAEDLQRLRTTNDRVWVVYSFPEYMDRSLVRELQDECPARQILPGTLGGGDVIVCRTGR